MLLKQSKRQIFDLDDDARRARTCLAPRCARTTNAGKLYCEEHVERMPYVRELLREIERRDAEEASAAVGSGWQKIDAEGSHAKEILSQLAQTGAETPKRLAVTVSLARASLEGYLKALGHAGLIQVLTLGSRRGTPRRVVDLTPLGALKADQYRRTASPDPLRIVAEARPVDARRKGTARAG
jgi:hypothetical protein